MKKLHICAEGSPLEFPADLVTQTLVVYGGKGMGKTALGAVIAEECSYAGLRFSLLDPVGVSYGLMHSADGKKPGLQVLVLGGRHGDIPIEPTAGAVVADLVADEEVDTLIDISRWPNGKMWGVGERIRFVTEYCLRLYERQGERMRPLMQIIDECGRFCPQNPPKGAIEISKCIGAIEQLVELGRNVGVGVTLLTQRSARMNKSISELAECMLAFRTVGPRSVDAIMDWCSDNVDKEKWRDIRESVRSLPRGSALVVSPGWLNFQGVVKIRKRHTLDSSATPTGVGKTAITARPAKPDLAKYRERMAETIAHVEQSNPKVLQRRVAELEQQLASAHELLRTERAREPVAAEPALNVAGIATLDRLATEVHDMTGQLVQFTGYVSTLSERANAVVDQLGAVAGEVARPFAHAVNRLPPQSRLKEPLEEQATRLVRLQRSQMVSPTADSASNGAGKKFPSGELRVLTAVVQHGARGVAREQLTVLTGFKKSTRDAYVHRLKNAGHVEEASDRRIVATRDGIELLGRGFTPLPTGHDLYKHWMQQLPEGEGRVLEVIVRAHPRWISRDAITDATGFKKSTRDAYVHRLHKRRLLITDRQGVVAATELFS